jgi:hypothetical protein
MEKRAIFKFYQSGEWIITDRDNFEETNLCECYDNYGIEIDCCTAGCYTLDNSECDARKDCAEYIKEKFKLVKIDEDGDEEDIEFEITGDCEIEFGDEDDADGFDIDAINAEIEKWERENACHTEVEAYTFHDGHNFKTLTAGYESDHADGELVEVEDEDDPDDEVVKILAEFDSNEWDWSDWAWGYRYKETENYTFTQSQFVEAWGYASVEEK